MLSEQLRHEDAIICYEKALNIEPKSVDALSNYGAALSELGRHEEALDAYGKALVCNPNSAKIQFNKGNVWAKTGKYHEAISSYQQAIALEQNYSDAYSALGNVWAKTGDNERALAAFNQALDCNPNNAKAHSNKGASLNQLFNFEEAIASYQRALDINPSDFQAWSNKGVSLHALKKHEEALAAYDRAISIQPDYAEAWSNKGITLNDLKRYEEALAAYAKAISIQPDYAAAWSNKGITLNDLKRYEEALAAYGRAISIQPDVDLLPGTILQIKMQICNWDNLREDLEKLQNKLSNGLNAAQPFPLLSLIEDPALQKQAAQLSIKNTAPENLTLEPINPISKNTKIRIGYFSADFRIHPVAFLTVGLFEHHNRDQFEIFAFSYGPNTKDAMRSRIENSVDQFLDVKERSDKEVSELARELGIDIAIDLTGATQFNRLGIFSYRAAPIQVNYLGYPGTSGANYFDYCIADSTLIPESEARHYTEKIVYLPNSYQANDDKRVISTKAFSRRDCDLPDSAFVFCCFNNNYKITPDIYTIWMNILRKIEGSVLWLFEDNQVAAKNLAAEASKQGISSARIIFAKHMAPAEHLARQKLADLFLDTLPYNAHTTASDALWAGLPVLTREGGAFPGRVAASLLKALSLPELITSTAQEYEDLAISLAKDHGKLTQLRSKLTSNILTESLFNTALFTQQLEKAYIDIYERSLAGELPESVHIG